MIDEQAIAVADAVMLEGAFLYPYRPSALKNRYRWTIGVVSPRGAGGAQQHALGGACLLRAREDAPIELLLRFMTDDATGVYARSVPLVSCSAFERHEFAFGALSGWLSLERTALGGGYQRLRVSVLNRAQGARADSRQEVLACSLLGVHVLLSVEAPDCFVSLCDPPAEAEAHAALCESRGLWCIPLGADRQRPRTALLSPIILPDFPQIAPESAGDMFDATEIDELLALRVRTLTEAEKCEAREADPRVRAMLERIEGLSAQEMLRLHGARRPADTARAADPPALQGRAVVLRPRRGGDAMDLLLSGRRATVRSVERDLDGRTHVGVTLDDDPGADLGRAGMPGHRFFFALDELELLEPPGEPGA